MSTKLSELAHYIGPVGPLLHRCAQCLVTGPQLLRCSGCRAVRYCSREHQVADRPEHKWECNGLKKKRVKLAKEEDLVRNAEEDFMTPANAFKTHVGRFWGIVSTREYMLTRLGLAERLRLIGTLDGVQESLDHMLDMLRLSRSDNLGVREIVPTVMLRLDLDQECYDFVKWWETYGLAEDYDWEALPFLHLHGQDALEAPKFLGKYSSLNFLTTILLLKLKLLIDIRNLKVTSKISKNRRLPAELQAMIELAVVRSPLASKNFVGQSLASLMTTEKTLLDQIRQIGAKVIDANMDFMFSIFDPDWALLSSPSSYARGSLEESALALQFSYSTWWEAEGVLDLLKDARACAARDSEDEIEEIRKLHIEEEKLQGCKRTAEEVMKDISVNRIWGYLDYAVENASYLGPWSERPSERHTRRHKETGKTKEQEEKRPVWPYTELYESI